jgi:lipopolysaccharide/colanic/teichoic acid biosynthesis glycosyltransferase
MPIGNWLCALSAKVWPERRTDNLYFLNEESFRYEITLERMRVDRNGSPLAILAVELPADRSETGDFEFLGRILANRLRMTDTPGFISGERIGVLLPDTPKSGAWKVASDICGVYPVGHDRPNCEVFVYPDDAAKWIDNKPQPAEEPAGDTAAAGIETLLMQRMPAWKRSIDVLGASIGLVLAIPLLLFVAAAIKITSRGPVLYSQEREGLVGRTFRIYKFRTMRPDADRLQTDLRSYSEQDGPAFKMSSDPRTTWIGRFLRRLSLDELPQLWNVLRGEMSLVGPRPLPTMESLECAPWQRRRLTVTPGMTCIWQVWGRNTVAFDEWMRMDLDYVRRRSFVFDAKLLLKTAPAILLHCGPR